jgi:fructokinase
MGHETILISAVGADELGNTARTVIQALGTDPGFIQTTGQFPTGTAAVQLGANGQTHFRIQRPAAYDAVQLSELQIAALARWAPRWLYFGTLFLVTEQGLKTLRTLVSALPGAATIYDLNLRPESYSPQLVTKLLALARVVKLNESEMETVAQFAGLPRSGIEEFCREGARRYGWRAVCVTLGARGCALLNGAEYVEADGYPVQIADTVGAGDGFTAALLHGLDRQWPTDEIAVFANRVGAIIASRPGGIPDWSVSEVLSAGKV